MREHILSKHPLLIPFLGALSGTLCDVPSLLLFFVIVFLLIKRRHSSYINFLFAFELFSIVTSIISSVQYESFCYRKKKIETGSDIIFQVINTQKSVNDEYLMLDCSIKSIGNESANGIVKIIIKGQASVSVGGIYCASYKLFKKNNRNLKFENFNYSRDVLGTLFVKTNQLSSLSGYGLNVFASSSWVRQNLILKLRIYLSEFSMNLYTRTFLGMKSGFTNEQLNGFKIAGVMHALTISGMHLAIIFGAIIFPIKLLMRKWYFTRWMKLLSIPLLWFYSNITGIAPPVERAFVFISISIISSLLMNRDVRIKDLVFTVGVVYLIFQPRSIFDISVQLSFAAVFGIAWIVPIFKSVYSVRNILLDFLWSSICMSLGCTISTLPFILYYFGEISSGFIIGNLLLGPLFTIWVVLCLLISLFVLLNFKLLYCLGCELMNYLGNIIEYINFQFFSLKIPVLKVSSFSTFELICCYLLITAAVIFLINLQESKSDKLH